MSSIPRRLEKRNAGEKSPLYVRRNVLNAEDIIAWAKAAGFAKTVPAEEMHVTQVFSREPMDWTAAGDSYDGLKAEGDARSIKPLGDKGAVVLAFELAELQDRWQQFRDAGASWDYESYQPHVTITYSGGDVDLSNIEPYDGPIEFGPEIYEDFNDDWKAGIVEKRAKVLKVDSRLGIVMGWGIICKQYGEDYYDLNIDREGTHKGKRVPEHVPEDVMFKAAIDFAEEAEMPGNEMHKGPAAGRYLSIFPLTTEVAKAFGIVTKTTGLMLMYKAPPEVLAKFESGDYSGFSIEGWVFEAEEND